MHHAAFFLLTVLGVLGSRAARADCLELISGPIEYEVTQCEAVDPEGLFTTAEQRDRFYQDTPAERAKELMIAYRGLMLGGKVVQSKAKSTDPKRPVGLLLAESPALFVEPLAGQDCGKLVGKKIAGDLRQECCDGHVDVPCLTKTSYVFRVGKPTKAKAKAKAKK